MKARRTQLAPQVAAVAAAAVVVAVVLAGAVALGLVRHVYDGQARRTLHREAILAATIDERAGTTLPTRAARVATRVLNRSGIEVLRVHADGTADPGISVDSADIQAAAAGISRSAIRTISGARYFVDVEPVADDGGVVVLQRASDTRPVTDSVLVRIGWALFAGLVVAVVLALFLARRLAKPLEQAAIAAHRLAHGERNVRLDEQGPQEVAQVADSLNLLASALQRSEGRQREFLLTISHELRSPLTAIKGFAEAVGDGVATGADAMEAGRIIQAEAGRLERLVSDLLDLARIGADDFQVDLAWTDLGALVHSAGQVWSARAAEADVAFSVQLPDQPVRVITDANRLRQVIDGLAENALRVTPAGAPIVIALFESGGFAVVQVRDGGPGLRDEDLPVAFDRSVLYERYRGVRQVGTGLGLALVGALVARLGGTAVAGHAPEGGAAFTISLPLPIPEPDRPRLTAHAPVASRQMR